MFGISGHMDIFDNSVFAQFDDLDQIMGNLEGWVLLGLG